LLQACRALFEDAVHIIAYWCNIPLQHVDHGSIMGDIQQWLLLGVLAIAQRGIVHFLLALFASLEEGS
jgi:hypothetical protein